MPPRNRIWPYEDIFCTAAQNYSIYGVTEHKTGLAYLLSKLLSTSNVKVPFNLCNVLLLVSSLEFMALMTSPRCLHPSFESIFSTSDTVLFLLPLISPLPSCYLQHFTKYLYNVRFYYALKHFFHWAYANIHYSPTST